MTNFIIGMHHEPSNNTTVKLKLGNGRVVCDTAQTLKEFKFWQSGLEWRYVTAEELEQLNAGKPISAWAPK